MYLVVVAIIGCVNVKLGSLLIVLPLHDIVYRIKPDVVMTSDFPLSQYQKVSYVMNNTNINKSVYI